MRLILAAAFAAALLAGEPRAASAMPLAAPGALAAATADASIAHRAAFACRRWFYGGHWVERCWWAYYGSGWPPTWRGSGWRGPGWYGPGWRKEYFTGYAGRRS